MRIVIAEDAAIIRDGLAHLLVGRGHDVVAGVGDPDALREAVARYGPDAAVVDIRMPPTHTDEGLRAAADLRRDHPRLGILLFSQYIETRYATRLLADSPAGIGYLLKERVADIDDFVDALRRVASGGTALDPEVVSHLLRAGRQGLDALTPRERDVLALMAEGRTNAAIARTLVVSERAVEKHVAGIFTKLDLARSDSDHRRVLAVLRYLNVSSGKPAS
jgi:DNA-binding NarL/FixJ family response regulator